MRFSCDSHVISLQVLLKECEEARGGVVSTSMSHDLSSDDISSSSQVISQHLVAFRWVGGDHATVT